MTFPEALEFFARYVWPFLLAWNVYLFRQVYQCRRDMYEYKLYVATNFTSKRDLEKMFSDFEARIDKRLDQFSQTISTK